MFSELCSRLAQAKVPQPVIDMLRAGRLTARLQLLLWRLWPILAKPTLAKTKFGQNQVWTNHLWPKPSLAEPSLAKPNLAKPTFLAKPSLAKPTFLANLTRISVLLLELVFECFWTNFCVWPMLGPLPPHNPSPGPPSPGPPPSPGNPPPQGPSPGPRSPGPPLPRTPPPQDPSPGPHLPRRPPHDRPPLAPPLDHAPPDRPSKWNALRRTALHRTAQNFDNFLFLPSLGGLLVGFWWCLKRGCPQMRTFGVLSCGCGGGKRTWSRCLLWRGWLPALDGLHPGGGWAVGPGRVNASILETRLGGHVPQPVWMKLLLGRCLELSRLVWMFGQMAVLCVMRYLVLAAEGRGSLHLLRGLLGLIGLGGTWICFHRTMIQKWSAAGCTSRSPTPLAQFAGG